MGSIAWDGYPDGIFGNASLPTVSGSEESWRVHVREFLASREDATTPDQGWPWPWDDSQTTDYAYAYEPPQPGQAGKVWASCFGHEWFSVSEPEPDYEKVYNDPKTAIFPNMEDRKNVAWDGRSGLMGYGEENK